MKNYCRKRIIQIVLSLFVFCMSDVYAQVDMDQEAMARFYINEGHYLIEVGKYLDSLESYDAAFVMSSRNKTITDALLAKASLLAIYLDAPNQALLIYQDIEQNYPVKAETAIYKQGLLLFEMNRFEEAEYVLNRSVTHFPKGKFRFQAEAVLKKIPVQADKKPPVQKPVVKPGPEERPVVKLPDPHVEKPPVTVKLSQTPRMRVKLSIQRNHLRINASVGSQVCAEKFGCGEKFSVKASGSDIILDGKALEVWELVFDSNAPLEIIAGSSKKKVRGEAKVRVEGGKLRVINELNIEDYLMSVVPNESRASWPMETLKAQAVAARTYAFYLNQHRQNKRYDLRDDPRSQCYGGVDTEHERSSKAVQDTEGVIMIHKGRPVFAEYSSNSGGHTADVRTLFNDRSKPYLAGKNDPLSLGATDGTANWSEQFTISEIESALRRATPVRCKGLEAVKIIKRGPSGRVMKIRFDCDNGSHFIRDTKTVRRFLCSKKGLRLKEILVDIQKTGENTYYIEGHGWGHGRGLSQWGANFMGKNGSVYQDVLTFYYTNTEVVKKW